jgi:2Fe-2S ferredoxin
MSLISVTLVQQDGVEVTINDAVVGDSLMETARSHGVVGILGDCGGGCACATCHVYMEPEWADIVGAPDDIEDMTLDMVSHVRKETSRLSCQIKLSPELDGLRAAVAPFD